MSPAHAFDLARLESWLTVSNLRKIKMKVKEAKQALQTAWSIAEDRQMIVDCAKIQNAGNHAN